MIDAIDETECVNETTGLSERGAHILQRDDEDEGVAGTLAETKGKGELASSLRYLKPIMPQLASAPPTFNPATTIPART